MMDRIQLRRRRPKFSLRSGARLLLALCAAPLLATASAQASSDPLVGQIRVDVPAQPSFVVRATMPVPLQSFRRAACPYKIVDPAGNALQTQWELVARMDRTMVVELLAQVDNQWSGPQVFDVVSGDNAFDLDGFDPEAIAMTRVVDRFRLQVADQVGGLHEYSLSGAPIGLYHRLGPNAITIRRHVVTPFGNLQLWMTTWAGQPHVEVVLNWHNGGLPARPDAYFESARLLLPADWRWRTQLPDPASERSFLVNPGQHVIPQRMERSFRVVLYPEGSLPELDEPGWGIADWTAGGYMPQNEPLPDLDHVAVDLTTEKEDDFTRLEELQPTSSGAEPESFLWPAQGVYYGGMTGGIEIHQFPAVPLAVTGQVDGLLSLYVEQLRYGSRQMGCIYDDLGHPIRLEEYLEPDGVAPWRMFDNRFTGNPPRDAPFHFSQTGPGNGSSDYDPLRFDPIDYQHFIRRTKANKALVWLANDPLAHQYVMMDAELGRMTYYEGPGGVLRIPSLPAQGINMGRGDAWVCDVRTAAYAIASDRWREDNWLWFWTFRQALLVAQMPNGLFSALRDGKVAKNPPYGDGHRPYFWVHRADEQVFLIHALRGIQETIGMNCNPMIRTSSRALWDYAWKPGTNGLLSRYPCGWIGARRFHSRAEWPAGIHETVELGNFHVATALATGQYSAAAMLPAVLAHTRQDNLLDALDSMKSSGLNNIENRANLLALLQDLLE